MTRRYFGIAGSFVSGLWVGSLTLALRAQSCRTVFDDPRASRLAMKLLYDTRVRARLGGGLRRSSLTPNRLSFLKYMGISAPSGLVMAPFIAIFMPKVCGWSPRTLESWKRRPTLPSRLTATNYFWIPWGGRRPPGMMLEGHGQKVEAHAKMFQQARNPSPQASWIKYKLDFSLFSLIQAKARHAPQVRLLPCLRAKPE